MDKVIAAVITIALALGATTPMVDSQPGPVPLCNPNVTTCPSN